MTTPVIQLEGVTKTYDAVTAVDHVSVSVTQRQLLVLLGSSGCGKTTTLRLVAGLERPNTGAVYLEGRPVADDAHWVQPEDRHIGMVFQDYALFPHLSVRQNIEFALLRRDRDKRKRVREMLSLVGLDGLGERFPHQLSGGQQQRVALARALAPAPSVVLLDEPFSNLDAALRKTMREEVRRILHEANATAIFVTHDQEEAMSLADRVAVMQAGEVLQIGDPATLYRYPAKLDVATFLGETNFIPGEASGKVAVTPLGTLSLVRPAEGDVSVMVRPESLSLVPDPEGDAVVKAVRFYGYYQMVTVAVGDLTLTARVWAQTYVTEGEHVRLEVLGQVVAFAGEVVPSS
jgi:iron(III) transport system ATP-binding protein